MWRILKVTDVKELKSFDKEFLLWFKKETEKKWMNYEEIDLHNLKSSNKSYCDFQKGTQWLQGLTESEISEIETKWKIKFPPDYKLFLQTLHSVDKPQICISFENNYYYEPSLYNWKEGEKEIEKAYSLLINGLVFDVEHNYLWLDTWGERPETSEKRKEKIQELVAKAPKLIPVFGHRFLLAEPCKAENPIISIVQSDIIVYDDNLRDYFIGEFLPPEKKHQFVNEDDDDEEEADVNSHKYELYKKIAFWGDLL